MFGLDDRFGEVNLNKFSKKRI